MSLFGNTGENDFGGGAGLVGAVGSIWGGFEKASGFEQEAAYYKQAAKYEQYSTGIKELANNRATYQKLGQGRADIGASGLKLSGTAADVMRSSAAEGAITRNLIGIQGKMDVNALLEQAKQASEEASAAKTGAIFGAAGDLLQSAGSFGFGMG